MAEQQKSKRQQIEELQAAMQGEQLEVARALVELIASDETAQYVAKLKELRDRMIPNGPMDQQITGFISNFLVLGQFAQSMAQQLQAQQVQPQVQP